jgi:hypothetical protein
MAPIDFNAIRVFLWRQINKKPPLATNQRAVDPAASD